LSLDDAAEALRLDREVVQALEAGEFESLGAAVFVKGYLRAYARLVGIDETAVVDSCRLSAPDPEQFRSVSVRREVTPRLNVPMLLLVGALLVLLLAGVRVLWPTGDPPTPTVATQGVESTLRLDEPLVGAAADARRARPAQPAVPAPVAAAPEAAAAPAPPAAPELPVAAPPVPVTAAPPAAPQGLTETTAVAAASGAPATVRLELRFADECWVEISDARRRLLYGLEKPGSVRSFEAYLPLRFYLGKTDAVAISVAGVTYNVPPDVRTGRNTARFVVTEQDLQLPQP
jgi:cytoskeleton protein RodZ